MYIIIFFNSIRPHHKHTTCILFQLKMFPLMTEYIHQDFTFSMYYLEAVCAASLVEMFKLNKFAMGANVRTTKLLPSFRDFLTESFSQYSHTNADSVTRATAYLTVSFTHCFRLNVMKPVLTYLPQ